MEIYRRNFGLRIRQPLVMVGLALLVGIAAGSEAGFGQSFQLSQNGKGVGVASLALNQAAGGFNSTSGAKVDMPGLKYSFTENETLDGGYHLKTVQLTGSVNGTSATVTAAPQGQQVQVKINAGGKVTPTSLQFHPQSVFYPDFDPAALQILLNLGAAHNNRDIWAIIPKQAGSTEALRIATNQDEQGTLDGQPVGVHHFTITSSTETTELFSGPGNQLMQAEWSAEGFALVRKGFVLKPPAKPRSAPPARQPAQSGQDGQAAPVPQTQAQPQL